MKVPFLGSSIDERFLEHRRRSTSAAGLAGAFVAGGLFLWRYYGRGVVSWDLLAVLVAVVVVKLAVLAWHRLKD